jgi:tRNA (guanine9-N1)-methyltransferase
MLELKPLKRQAEKVRRQQRAHELSAGYAAGTLSEADKQIFEERRAREREKRNAKKQEKLAGDQPAEGRLGVWGGAVIMDLGFDELMTDNVSFVTEA